MSNTHLERIADLLPEDQREHWLRISSRLPNANKDSQDELWLLAELIAMVGLAMRDQPREGEGTLVASTDGRSRDVAEKERQTAATMERLAKSIGELKKNQKGTGRPVGIPLAIFILMITVLLLLVQSWLIWQVAVKLGLHF